MALVLEEREGCGHVSGGEGVSRVLSAARGTRRARGAERERGAD